MCLVVKNRLLVAVFICFLAYPMNAEICFQDFMNHTVAQCGNCTGDLKVVLAPNQTVPYDSDGRIRSISCTVNKPANVSIFFENNLKPYNAKPLELTKDGKVKGITVTKLNGGCTYTIYFDENSKSLCQYGHFTCKAVANAYEAISRTIRVSVAEEESRPPMTFTVEDDALQKSKELILGTYANLSCSYKSLEWNKMVFFRPFIFFLRLDKDGRKTEIKDSPEKPPNYENEGKIEIRKPSGETPIGTRKLFLRRIDAGAAATYFCRVRTTHGCHLEKKLVLTTRPCKKGHYCHNHSSTELPCREGTYSNITGSFNASNCRICPLDSYCPSGSTVPSPCPKFGFLPAMFTRVKLYQGKGKERDCRSCPVDPCDNEDSKCSFICSEGYYKGVLGQPITIRCALSNGTLLRNLTWFRGQKKIVNSSSYEVFREDKAFVLKIHKASQGDSGDYNCSGFDVIMGNHFFSTINLVATDPGRSYDILLILSVAFVSLVVITGVLVQKYLRRKRHGDNACKGRESRPNEMMTPVVLETLGRETKALYGGNPYKYDVFICYSGNDKTWVRGTLLPKLKSFNLQVCIDFEDFSPGSYIIENVAEAIYLSRKTVAVLSPDFLNSDWCHKELMMALKQVNNEHKVIPVMYRECQVPLFLCGVTYLDWCNEDVRQTFWKQLLKTIDNGNYLGSNDIGDCLEENDTVSTVDI